ncbi:MAG TPA: penicillin acylase family protein [Ferruginibacter sp.]|nr:penicillin acylase family protein [Ferruginibacter sp.]
MRVIPFLICSVVSIALVVALNMRWTIGGKKSPVFGSFLSPQQGFWQNAEATNTDYNADLKFPQLKGKVNVYFDDRLVPHVFAEQENDAYFVQGYLHARFRLWQMEFQTHVAAGRLSEVLGGDQRYMNVDRMMRRLGMVYAAEASLKEMEKDTVIKAACDAYTSGVNAYIGSLTQATKPLEYKILDYSPEKWTNLKTALFLKYMSLDLAGGEWDFEMTNTRSYFNADDFAKLFPDVQDSLDPIIPKGTPFLPQKVFPKAPASADSLYLNVQPIQINEAFKPDPGNGSNNWVVSGKKTKSGAPILCNDPHLGLNLPSLWYEIQISTPAFNAYGASFPGSPGVIIGFNDSCAFGFTNGGRDVRDYYEVQFKDDTRKQYMYNGEWHTTQFRIDTIRVKDKDDFIDSVAYVQLGDNLCPVMFDRSYSGGRNISKKSYAVRWKAHDPSNELKIFNLLDHAKNYADYEDAVTHLHTPGQNCAFACKNGDIAIRTQGEYPAKWKGQGDFVMPGTDSAYLWQGYIPQDEVPFQYNPERGFVSSANQKSVDESYPYYLGRNYPIYRGLMINKRLNAMNDITIDSMEALQTDNYNILGRMLMPLIMKNLKEDGLNADEKNFATILKDWNFRNDVGSKGATVFEVFWKNFSDTVYSDEYAKVPRPAIMPFESTLAEALLKDSSYKFVDDITTPQKETLADEVTAAFKKTAKELGKLPPDRQNWEKYKGTMIRHLLRIPELSRLNLNIGGGIHNINAAKDVHGPSWRMVVELTPETNAYGIYPGGQSGNPGSKYYDTFVSDWAGGKYYKLWVMKQSEEKDNRVKWKMSFSK